VTRPEGRVAEFYLAGGLTIGRSLANTVVLTDDEAVDRTHARVEVATDGTAHLRRVEPGGSLVADGAAVRELGLDAGVQFRIGRTEFRCVAGRREPVDGSDPAQDCCPFCGSSAVSRGGQAARECVGCHHLVLPVLLNPDDSVPVLLPALYGDYRAERFVARGGMGLVLRGARANGEPAAIKVLLPGSIPERRDAEPFEHEVAMLARVRTRTSSSCSITADRAGIATSPWNGSTVRASARSSPPPTRRAS